MNVTNPATGRIWMDRNLGARRAATSSTDTQAYGDLYQWGRRADEHEKRNSPTTTTLSTTDQPGNGSFILAPNSPYDWRSTQKSYLWQVVSGVNNPCPVGYRLPTAAEWEAEMKTWSSNDATGSSLLNLPLSGGRNNTTGTLFKVNSNGYYWSSSGNGFYARYLTLSSAFATVLSYGRGYGFSVRCIKE